MTNGFISRALLIAFVAALAVVPLSILLFPHSHQASNTNDALLVKAQPDLLAMLSGTPTPVPASAMRTQLKPSPTEKQIAAIAKVSVTNSPTPSKTPIAMKIQSIEVNNQNLYTSLDKSFSFTYPSSWKLIDQKNNNVYNFFFSPSGSTDDGQFMNIAIFDPASSVQEVIAKDYFQYSNSLTYQHDGSLGDKALYKLTSTDNSFGSFGIVLGKMHTYIVSFDNNGTRSIIDQIEKQIWPTFKFQ